jgi:acetyl esterase/lipase
VFFHGGFWRTEYTRDTIDGLAADLASRGWTTVNVEYRRGRSAGWPAPASDTEAALDTIHALDGPPPSTTVHVGHSVGAHLAFWAAGRHTPAPDVAVGLDPVLDLAMARDLDLDEGAVARLTPARTGDEGEVLAAAAVAVGASTRQLLVHGRRDSIVPIDMSRAYVAAAAPLSVELVELDAGHFELLDPARAAWNDIVAAFEG